MQAHGFFVCGYALLYLLRSPNSGNSYNVRCVNRDGDISNAYAYNDYMGVRPALISQGETE